MGKGSITRELAAFIHRLSPQELPPGVLERAKIRILDGLSTGIAGIGLPVPSVALEAMKNHPGQATVLGSRHKIQTADAAFVNAALINGRSQDDFLFKSHPGAITIPAALATGEECMSSGADVLTSIVAGYEIVGRIFWGGPSMLPKFRATGVNGPMGAAATAGKLLKLSEDQLVHALGCAAIFSSGFGEGFLSGTMDVKLNVGMASRNGVTAALLAQKGATAAETSLEGRSGFYNAFAGTAERAGAVTEGLGKRFLINEVVYKECPACIFVQTPISLAKRLVEEKRIPPEKIEKVRLTAPQATYDNPGFRNLPPFTAHLQAAVSAKFCTAAALLGKAVTSYEFYDRFDDAEVLELAGKIDLNVWGDNERVQIKTVLKDGSEHQIEGIEGETLSPTPEKIKAKFERLASGFLGKKTARVVDLVLNLDRVKSITQLTDELRAP